MTLRTHALIVDSHSLSVSCGQRRLHSTGTWRLAVAHRTCRRAAHVVDPRRRQNLGREHCRNLGSSCSGRSRLDNQPRGLYESLAGRQRERGDVVRADDPRHRQLEQCLRDRQRHGLRRVAAALRCGDCPPRRRGCPGGITSAATRIVRLDASATIASAGLSFGRGAAGYRTLLGEPGEGVPLEGRAAGPGRAAGDPGAGARGGAAPPALRVARRRGRRQAAAAVLRRSIEFRARHLSSRVERSACSFDPPVSVT